MKKHAKNIYSLDLSVLSTNSILKVAVSTQAVAKPPE